MANLNSASRLRARGPLRRGRGRSARASRPGLEVIVLEPRVLLDAAPSILPVGAGSIFTQLPPPAEGMFGTDAPYLTPSDQPAIASNIVGDTIDVHEPPDIAPGSPAASKPVASNQTWSSVLTRDPSQPAYLTNSQAYVLVDADGKPITGGTGNLMSYDQYYARLGEAPPAPNAPFFGKSIVATTTNGATTYQYSNAAPGLIGYPYAANAGNPVAFGDLSFSTNLYINSAPDTATNFGLANTPFPTTPGTLFTLTSTARYLDYRTGAGPNGANPVTVQQMGASGQFQTVASNGLVPYFYYQQYPGQGAVNTFSSPNKGDLAVTVLDLNGAPLTGPYDDPTGIDSNDIQLYDYSDSAATFTWGDEALGRFNVTMSETSPFAQFTFTRGTSNAPLTLLLRNNAISGLNTIDNTAAYDAADNAIVITGYLKPNASSMAIVQDPNVLVKVFYAVYLPTGFDASGLVSNSDGSTYQPGLSTPEVPLFGIGANDVLVNVPGGFGTQARPLNFVIASLPNPDLATVALFRKYAFNYITGGTNTLTYDAADSQVGATLGVTTRNVDPASTAAGALLETSPLQYDHLDANTYNALYLQDPTLPGADLTLSTPFGQVRQMAAPTTNNGDGTFTSSMSYSLPYDGSLSLVPMGAFVSTDPNDHPTVTRDQLDQEIQLVQGLLANVYPGQFLTNGGTGNTYVWGQELQKLTSLVPIADQLGLASERDMLIEMVESEMTQWFNAATTLNDDAPGQSLGYDPHFGVPQFFYYDRAWDALTGYNAGFGADLSLNDTMYQFGYWIQAASTVAMYDPSFLKGYGPMITMIARNVDNWDRSDTMFPYLRTFDAYAGHSWASGVAPVGSGQNLESISEAINFDSALIAWGSVLVAGATGPSDPDLALGTQIENTGVELKTLETASYQEYYLDANHDTFPPITIVTYKDTNGLAHTYAAGGYVQLASYLANPNDYTAWKPEIYASNQFLMQRGTETFFASADNATGNNAESHYAISVLPIGPSALYLGADPALARANYNNYIAQQNAVYGAPTPGTLRALPIAYPAEMLFYQALFDPAGALARWDGIGNYRYDYPAGTAPATAANDNYSTYSFQPTLDTPAATYYYLQFFNKYGEVNGGVRGLGAAQTAVMDQAVSGQPAFERTYIVENLGAASLASVDFSDGYTVSNVPARSVYAVTVERDGSGPVAGAAVVTNTYAIPDLSAASAGPPAGGGSNLYLGYSNPAAPQTKAAEPLTLQPRAGAGMVAIAPYTAQPQNATYQYPYATPDVYGPDPNDPDKNPPPFFAGAALPADNIVSFQVQNVNGTYDPSLDTQFQLYFKAPLGVNMMDLQVGVQVSYSTPLAGGGADSYVETYPKVSISGFGGLVVLTNQTLGVIGAVSDLGTGVAAATHTVGTGQVDPNLHFDVFQPGGQNQNLLYPSYYPATDPNAKLLGRTAQFSPQPFQLKNATITFTVFVARFNNNAATGPQYANPSLQFFAGLPSYQGMQSFVTVPFNNLSIGKGGALPPPPPPPPPSASPTSLALTAGPIVNNLGAPTLRTAVASHGAPVDVGEVQFFEDGATLLGTAPVVDGAAVLALARPLGPGNHVLTALYTDASGAFQSSAAPAQAVEVDRVVVRGSRIDIVRPDGSTRARIAPLGRRAHRRLNVVGVAPDHGGDPLLVVAPKRGRRQRVRVYDAVTGRLIESFRPDRRPGRHGTSLAAVSVDDRVAIVTAPGRGAPPIVRTFDAFTGRPLLKIRAFPLRDRRGMTIATTENADGAGFTITATTHVRHHRTLTGVFNGETGALLDRTTGGPRRHH